MKKYLKLSILYLKKNWLTALFWGYIFGSILLKAVSEYDLTIPCPINRFGGIRCYGCGLTTATIFIIKLDFISAWKANPLAFVIDPLLIFFIVRHWWRFIKEETVKST